MIDLGETLWLSLKVALVAMLVVVPFAITIARWLAKAGLTTRIVVSALAHLPLVLPPVVTGYVLLLVFGRRGVVGQWLDAVGLQLTFTWFGAALAAGVVAFPLVLRPVRLAFESTDPRLEQMAATLGAGRWRRAVTIAFPLALPGLVAGTMLGFAKAMGEFGATITFVSNIPGETQTLSLAIYTLLQSPRDHPELWWMIGFSIAVSVIAVVVSEVLAGRLESQRGRE